MLRRTFDRKATTDVAVSFTVWLGLACEPGLLNGDGDVIKKGRTSA